MSVAITRPPPSDSFSWAPVLWAACFALVVGLHVGAAWIAVHWMPEAESVSASPPAAVMIELAPLAVAPAAAETEIPPGPEQTVSEPPPPPPSDIQPPLPEAPPSPAPKVTVPVPPKSEPPPVQPRPVARPRAVEHRLPPPRRIPIDKPPASATMAPLRRELAPAPVAAAPARASHPERRPMPFQPGRDFCSADCSSSNVIRLRRRRVANRASFIFIS